MKEAGDEGTRGDRDGEEEPRARGSRGRRHKASPLEANLVLTYLMTALHTANYLFESLE